VIYLSISRPGKFWIEAVRTHGHDIEVFYKGEKIPLDEPARGVKKVER